MKRIASLLFVLMTTTLISGCGAIFGGHIGYCQKHADIKGVPARQIRPVALGFDILTLPFMIIALPVDFATGGIYKPCSLPTEVVDSLDKRKELHRERTSARDKFLTILNDPLQGLFCEDENIGIEHPFTKNFTAGLNYANVHPIGFFYVNPLSPAQRDWPGTVYYGNSIKLELKFFNNKKPSTYVGLNFEYKSLWYNNVPFFDQVPSSGTDPEVALYTRNEKAKVFGLDFVFGHEQAILHKTIMIDYFIGFGFRDKFRNISTYDASAHLTQGSDIQVPLNGFVTDGNSTANIFLPTPIIGLRIGINVFKKKQDKFGLRIGQNETK